MRTAAATKPWLAFLREFSLSDFNPKAPPPKTAAFWQTWMRRGRQRTLEMADALEDSCDGHRLPLSNALLNNRQPPITAYG